MDRPFEHAQLIVARPPSDFRFGIWLAGRSVFALTVSVEATMNAFQLPNVFNFATHASACTKQHASALSQAVPPSFWKSALLTMEDWVPLSEHAVEGSCNSSNSGSDQDADALVSYHSLDGRFIFVTPNFEEWLGYDSIQATSLSLYELVHPDDLLSLSGLAICSSSRPLRASLRLLRVDGTYITVEGELRPIWDEYEKYLSGFQCVLEKRVNNSIASSRRSSTFENEFLSTGLSNSSQTQARRKRERRPRPSPEASGCANCSAKVSPEWRRGPDGKKSLCNACGIRYSKQVKKMKTDL